MILCTGYTKIIRNLGVSGEPQGGDLIILFVKKVLIVDDDPEDQQLIAEALQGEGLECLAVSTPVEGLDKAVSWRPDVIVLDMKLPQMSGFGYLRELQRRMGPSIMPVIIVTEIEDEEVAEVIRDIGAAGYITKQCIDQALVPMVRQYVQ